MKNLALILALVLIAAVATAGLVGAVLPREHVATRAVHLHETPSVVWEAITNYRQFPSWRMDVKSVEPLANPQGHTAWVEVSGGGWQAKRLPLEIADSNPPAADRPGHLITRISDPNLPFSGTWTYELLPAPGGCLLRITEDGAVPNPFFRFMGRFVFGYRTTIDNYLKALGRKFGEDARLED